MSVQLRSEAVHKVITFFSYRVFFRLDEAASRRYLISTVQQNRRQIIKKPKAQRGIL